MCLTITHKYDNVILDLNIKITISVQWNTGHVRAHALYVKDKT